MEGLILLEDDYNYLNRIEEYARRRWQEPLICTYLWDKYDLETNLLNRQRLICRCDTDYAYDEDYNLRIINIFNTTSPFINQTLRINSVAYNSNGEIEEGYLVLYVKYDGDTEYRVLQEAPHIQRIVEKLDFNIITKFYPPDVTEWATTINPLDEPNISDITHIHVRDYTEADYYVSSTGDDNSPGTIDEPFRTLQHASNVIPAGGTICILTDLILSNSVVFYTNCNIICKNDDTILNSSKGQFLTLLPDTQLYLQGMLFKKEDKEIYNYTTGHYINNSGNGLVTIETEEAKPIPTYELDLESDLYWISGETVTVELTESTGALKDKTILIFNSLNELIATLTEPASFEYTVPHGLEYDTITVIILEDAYSYSKTFEVYNISSDWYVDTVYGDDNNTGKSLHDAFKTLEQAIAHVTLSERYIFYQGEEIINKIHVPLFTYIRGLKNKSRILCDDDIYFNISSNLNLSNLFLDNTLIDTVTFTNNGTCNVDVLCFDKIKDGAIYVEGRAGDNSNTGERWINALKTLDAGLNKKPATIYFADENKINNPLHVYETVEIIGTMNNNQITNKDDAYFTIPSSKVLKLTNITLKNSTKTATIKNNTYTNNGTTEMEVII